MVDVFSVEAEHEVAFYVGFLCAENSVVASWWKLESQESASTCEERTRVDQFGWSMHAILPVVLNLKQKVHHLTERRPERSSKLKEGGS